MSDFVISADSNVASSVTEHSFKRVLSGDVAAVRERLIKAIESFNYIVLSDEPLYAKRGGSFSVNVLECSLKLAIILRQSSTVSTSAMFNYTIPLSMVTKGDLHTLEREAEAIIAVATKHPTAGVCPTCGTNNAGESHFCRGCGAPNTGNVPAELEVLRLTAGARAGHQTVVTGVLVLLTALAIFVPLILFGKPKGIRAGWVLLMIGQLIGWFTLLYGIVRLHRTLNPRVADHISPSMNVSGTVRPIGRTALPPQTAWSSVTEGTTELLRDESEEPVAVPVNQKRADTDAMN